MRGLIDAWVMNSSDAAQWWGGWAVRPLPTHSPTHSITQPSTQPTFLPRTHSTSHPLTHSFTHSLTYLLNHSPAHSPTYSISHPLIHSPTLRGRSTRRAVMLRVGKSATTPSSCDHWRMLLPWPRLPKACSQVRGGHARHHPVAPAQ